MDTENLAEQYVQDFDLNHFEEVPVKKESICMERLPSMMNCNGGLMQLSHSSPPPPHHLLTPPSHQADDYSVVTMAPHSIMIAQNTGNLMYPDTPGTPPDTPPESNSPRSPPSRHYLEVAAAQQHITHQHKLLTANGAPPPPHMVDEMGWLMTQPLTRQEPLDLRPNSELPEEWSPLPPHSVVLTTPGKRMNPDYNHHHHHSQDDMDLNPPTPQVNISSRSSNSSRLNSSLLPPEDIINDDMLTQLSVRELNKRLHGFPREAVVKLKQKRRTLKNRGYAQNCRSKRLQQRHQLEVTNRNLHVELQKIKLELTRIIHERDMYKYRYEQLRRKDLGNRDNTPMSPDATPEIVL
ncbi:hypothetical protein O3M35_005662 [Rhynocoris fuscipes]|uniref:BZIP domain-containing protein n=1 Tax=Rhynocoris fuscipes TaxID=488301 RepID=A0AAW1DL56_9HEMI